MKLPETFAKKGRVNVIVESPAGNRNKYAYDEKSGLFLLKKVLPAGMQFPCDMGFIPRTIEEDGDPADALVLASGTTYPGCLIECRMLGIIKAKQTDRKGRTYRNDRFLLVPAATKELRPVKDIKELSEEMLGAVIAFFENYNQMAGKKFKVLSVDSRSAASKELKKLLTTND
jgi:inorganic pyrophosphatase